ncbi:MAG TPA: leucyl aminopeptidase [Armatimonadota bacterium]|jgi:leucyl aminopeptidase
MTVSVTSSLTSLDENTTPVVLFALTDEALNVSEYGHGAEQAVSSGLARRNHMDVTLLATEGRRVLLVGLGDAKDFTPLRLKRAAGAAARWLGDRNTTSAAFVARAVPGLDEAACVDLIVGGVVLGAYDAGLLKSKKEKTPLERLTVVSADAGAGGAATRAMIVAEAANLARDLVNAPANDLLPADLARRAAEAGRAAGLDVEVFDKAGLERIGFTGTLAVSAGSASEPSFTVMKHLPNEGQAPIVLVGKGLCFDSGGISLKPGAEMHHMKGDMAGAAAVVGALVAAARLSLPVNVIGLIPASENMPDGGATRPSDVITYANGKTVEVVNTDAEGRLVLADALIYGEREFHPRAMVDLATLTGACVVAVGGEITGLFTDHDDLANDLLAAAERSTEPVWRLPLYHPYRTKFDSGVADMTNCGDRWGGSITAALFLAEFVDTAKWAHLDIAGPAFDDTDKAFLARGGTGYGVSLLVEYVEKS